MEPVAALAQALDAVGADYAELEPGSFAVQLPGQRRLKTTCWLIVGDHAVQIEAFVVRKPDENADGVHAFLLQRNTRMYGVAWSVDATGDIYLSGHLPFSAISAEEVDRILGAVLEYADGTFNTLLELGFGSSIRREWAWRVKNGESLANLSAFAAFVERTSTPSRGG
jgi:hypothetical protein